MTASADLNSLLQLQSLWISPAVPSFLVQAAISNGVKIVSSSEQATIRLDVDLNQEDIEAGGSTWIYSLVAPFPTITDGISMNDLMQAWSGEDASSLLYTPVWMEESTMAAMIAILGYPNPAFLLNIGPKDQLLESAWGKQPSFAIIPFEDIEPRWKVISINGQSPICKDFDLSVYPLKIRFGFSGERVDQFGFNLPETNRDPDKLTTLVMTGVTALVRYTALKMELNGRTYPGEAIRDWLVNADITHISNEIPFSLDCPYPEINNYALIFCSNPLNIELLDYIGTDVVELTGNHFQDWGSQATLYTIALYDQRNWPYFGGGFNLEDARKSITLEHNGNKLAFIGCNPAGPEFAWATETEPGASRCVWSWVKAEVDRLRSEGYLPIMTFQYFESYGVYPGTGQMADFRMMADAGALIVSGSQAHLPQTMEFYNGSFIHYGLGNLFFDQMDFPVVGTRREFIDRHVIYNGKYINTELLTALLEDYSRPRPMTEEERKSFLADIFVASGW
ncbi:MAG: CapA family protein [Chloroflexota bacterium]